MATVLHEKKIKSADRVLEIFEMFNAERRAITVMEVARELSVPQSSTSELLANLVRRGYLQKDRGARAYRPTSRVALLGAWVHPILFRHGNLLSMIDGLSEETGLGVVLASTVGVTLKHIHTVGELPEALASGTDQHLLRSPLGHALLTTKLCGDLRLLVQRLNAESEEPDHVSHAQLSEEIHEVSRRGYAVGDVCPGWTGVAVLLPQSNGEEQLALGIVGRTGQVEHRVVELTRGLRKAIGGEVGLRLAADRSAQVPDLRYASTY